eukprot:143396-Chlamydomonas_euryale.AAC.1
MKAALLHTSAGPLGRCPDCRHRPPSVRLWTVRSAVQALLDCPDAVPPAFCKAGCLGLCSEGCCMWTLLSTSAGRLLGRLLSASVGRLLRVALLSASVGRLLRVDTAERVGGKVAACGHC